MNPTVTLVSVLALLFYRKGNIFDTKKTPIFTSIPASLAVEPHPVPSLFTQPFLEVHALGTSRSHIINHAFFQVICELYSKETMQKYDNFVRGFK